MATVWLSDSPELEAAFGDLREFVRQVREVRGLAVKMANGDCEKEGLPLPVAEAKLVEWCCQLPQFVVRPKDD